MLCTGDDLIGPRDIKKGLHMLANANIKTLEEAEDEEIDAQENIDLEANRKKRIKKHDKTDTLTLEQMNQVWRTPAPLPFRTMGQCVDDCLLSCMMQMEVTVCPGFTVCIAPCALLDDSLKPITTFSVCACATLGQSTRC